MPNHEALPVGAGHTEDLARPRRQRARGRGGCCATCHRQQAHLIALIEALVLRGMPSFSPDLTPAAYLTSLYQAAARREAGRQGAEPGRP